MQAKDFVTLLISTAAFCVSLAVLIFNRKKDRITQTYAFLNEWRSQDFYAATRYVRGDFKARLSSTKVAQGFRGLPEDEAARLRRVTHFLDYVGRALESGVLYRPVLLTTIGEPTIELWRILGPLVKAERSLMEAAQSRQSLPPEGYRQVWQSGFETLAERSRRFLHKHRIRELPYEGELYAPKSDL